jgi:GNAT superfamily N-acetyltransferase
MWWRVERGGRLWEQTRGEPARRRLRALVRSGRATGILAFDGEEPVGWCAFGPRRDFPRLERVRAYRREDAGDVWSVNCFFIARPWRGRGVAKGLLRAALRAIRARGGGVVEGYPVTTTRNGRRLPAAFAYTGPLPIFEEEGFEVVQRLSRTRPLVRRRVRR